MGRRAGWRKGKDTMMLNSSVSLCTTLVFCLVMLGGCTTGGSQSTMTPNATPTSATAVPHSTMTPPATLTSPTAVPHSTMAPTAAPASPTAHWLYVVDDGAISIYDIDKNHALVKQIPIPETGKRGVAFAPSLGLLYISFCGATTCNGSHCNLLAYDLVHTRLACSVSYPFWLHQFAVTPDCSKIYMPHGTDSSDGTTSVLDALNDKVIAAIYTGTSGHNTI